MAPHSHVRDQTWWKTPWVKEKESEIFGKIQAMEETILEMDEENLEDSGVDLSTDLWDVTSPSNMHADVDEEDIGDDLSFIGHETRHVMTGVLNNALSGEPKCQVVPKMRIGSHELTPRDESAPARCQVQVRPFPVLTRAACAEAIVYIVEQ
ncbi:hypothetical protein R1sor_003496 [Riccia sorocarpa]|uniref:Uncharacterized protein n=1 Tax=Riccia sorocarpa TaxID=122646 RepID=A0ABD3H7X8_9MARC